MDVTEKVCFLFFLLLFFLLLPRMHAHCCRLSGYKMFLGVTNIYFFKQECNFSFWQCEKYKIPGTLSTRSCLYICNEICAEFKLFSCFYKKIIIILKWNLRKEHTAQQERCDGKLCVKFVNLRYIFDPDMCIQYDMMTSSQRCYTIFAF